jgi:hypothetical protein
VFDFIYPLGKDRKWERERLKLKRLKKKKKRKDTVEIREGRGNRRRG